MVAVHDAHTGDVIAVHVGNALGAIRTGALGGAALSLAGPKHPCRVAVIGAGTQALTQLRGAAAVLDITRVDIASRTPASRDRLARTVGCDLGLDAHSVATARDAVDGADVVVLATSSSTPVIDSDWLNEDVFVTTLGPKQVGRSEFPIDLVTDASLVTTDSPDQLRAYDPPALVAAKGVANTVTDLADIAVGHTIAPRSGRRVYLSVGLSGTEVHLLGRYADQRRTQH